MAELGSNGKYNDLQYTDFPASVDSWEDVADVSADSITLANQYRQYCEDGNYSAAQQLLENNPTLKKMQINALTINQIRHATMALERMFKDDIETYVKDQVFADDLMFSTYTHTYNSSTKTHNFKGKGPNGKAKCVATFQSGDKITVNGNTCPAWCGPDNMSDAGSNVIVNGRWVTFIYDGSQINFKGGGGAASSDIAAATATSGLVLNGKTFYAGSSKGVKTGTLPNCAVAGGGDDTVGLNSSKFPRVGVTPYGGSIHFTTNTDGVQRFCFQAPYGAFGGPNDVAGLGGDGYIGVPPERFGDASADQILKGHNATSKNGLSLSGTMPDNGAVSVTLDAGGSYIIPKGYHNGSGKVRATPLSGQSEGTATAANILKGKTAWVNGTKLIGTMENRGQYQYCGGVGEGADSSVGYLSLNAIPEGAYFSNNADWAPEIRVKKDVLYKYLQIDSSKIVSGQSIGGTGSLQLIGTAPQGNTQMIKLWQGFEANSQSKTVEGITGGGKRKICYSAVVWGGENYSCTVEISGYKNGSWTKVFNRTSQGMSEAGIVECDGYEKYRIYYYTDGHTYTNVRIAVFG